MIKITFLKRLKATFKTHSIFTIDLSAAVHLLASSNSCGHQNIKEDAETPQAQAGTRHNI